MQNANIFLISLGTHTIFFAFLLFFFTILLFYIFFIFLFFTMHSKMYYHVYIKYKAIYIKEIPTVTKLFSVSCILFFIHLNIIEIIA